MAVSSGPPGAGQSTGRQEGAAGPGGPGAPSEPADGESDETDPRRTAHEVLGQTHALLHDALGEVIPYWCPAELQSDLRATRGALAQAIGAAHAQVATGQHDQGLTELGLGGSLSRPKRNTLRLALERFTTAVRTMNVLAIRSWLKVGAGAAETVVGSLAKEIPGGEVISEAAGGIVAAIEAHEAAHLDR